MVPKGGQKRNGAGSIIQTGLLSLIAMMVLFLVVKETLDDINSSTTTMTKEENKPSIRVQQQQQQQQQSREGTSTTITSSTTTASHFPLILSRFASKMTTRDGLTLEVHDIPDSPDGRYDEEACSTWKGGKRGTPTDFACKIEWDEWRMSHALVQEKDVVLELGARFGTTSCVLSRQVGLEGAVVAVEPDYRVHGLLLRNVFDHGCYNVHIVTGTVSETPLFMPDFGDVPNGYGAQTSEKKEGNVETLPHISYQDVQRAINRQFNVALIDCEGCLPSVIESGLLSQIELIVMEEDGSIDYKNTWHQKLMDESFECVWYIKDTVNPQKGWSKDLRHSSWIRKGSNRSYPTCEEYRNRQTYDPQTELICSTCPSPSSG